MTISPSTFQLFFLAMFVLLIIMRAVGFARVQQSARQRDERLERIERQIAEIQRRLDMNVSSAAPSPWDSAYGASTRSMSLDSWTVDGVRQLVREGRKIEAIKLVRDKTGMGLKEAKDAVEEIERQM